MHDYTEVEKVPVYVRHVSECKRHTEGIKVPVYVRHVSECKPI